LDETARLGAKVENRGLLFETGRSIPFTLDQSEERGDGSCPQAHRDQRTIGKEDFEESQCRLNDPTRQMQPTQKAARLISVVMP